MSSPLRPNPDPYAILGVTPDMPFTEVRAVHRRLVRELHPDVNPGARDRFDAVQSAFEVLRAQHASDRRVVAHPGQGAVESAPASGRRPPVAEPPLARAQPAGNSAGAASVPPRPGAVQSGREQANTSAAPRVDANQPVSGRSDQPSAPRSGVVQAGARQATTPAAPRSAPTGVSGGEQVQAGAAAQPRSGAVRVEAAPDAAPDGAGLRVVALAGRDRLLLQPRAQMLYVLLQLDLSEQVGSSTQPLNLSLVLDHSSSMQREDKLQRLKEAVSRIIDMMSPRDHLSIVTFGDRATVLLPSGPLGSKRAAKEALDSIRCRGGTEISTGLRAGLQELQAHAASLISQMILLTDGQTYGDEDICVELATQAGDRQVQITALGLGDDWNSTLLDELASRTGGHSDYVQSAEQLGRVFEDQLRMLQMTALRNLQMTINPDLSSRLLRATWVSPGIKILPVPNEAPVVAQPVHLELGRLSTDRDYRLLLEFVVSSRSAGTADVAEIVFTYDVPAFGLEDCTSICRISTVFVDRWDIEPAVHTRVHDALRKITAHRLQEQAMQAIQEGQTQKGTASLRTAAKHLEAAGSPELARLAMAEADRVERQGQAQAGNMKRIIYGTRSLG